MVLRLVVGLVRVVVFSGTAVLVVLDSLDVDGDTWGFAILGTEDVLFLGSLGAVVRLVAVFFLGGEVALGTSRGSLVLNGFLLKIWDV